MATFRGLMPETMEPWVSEIFFKRLTRIPPEYTQMLKIKTSDKAFEDVFKVAGLGSFILKPEGTPISYDDPIEGARRRFTHSTYALGVRFTEEVMDDDQHGIIRQMPEDLADSAIDHQETIAWQPFRDAFVTTTFTTLDGAALCSTAHTELKTGATVSNELNPGVALSHTGLESMLTQLRQTDNDQGRPIKLTPRWLLIHTDNEWEAARILESTQEPFTTENQINTMQRSRIGLQAFPARYLTDSDDFFVVSDEHTVTWWNRKTLDTDQSTDSNTKDQLFDARYRAAVAPIDWPGVNGSSV